MAALRRFHNRVIPSEDIQEFLDAIEKEITLDGAAEVVRLVNDHKEIPFTGLYISPVNIQRTIQVGNNFMECESTVLDVFGYSFKTPIVLRITGWTPSFMVRMPACVGFEKFKKVLMRHISCQGSSRYTPLHGLRIEEVSSWRDFGAFEFGRKPRFAKIIAGNISDAYLVKRAAIKAFQDCWSLVRTCTENSSNEGIWKPIGDLERSQHEKDRMRYPLRFTRNLSLDRSPYLFMSETGLPLVNHLTISDYKWFEPGKSGIRAPLGLEVDWTNANANADGTSDISRWPLRERKLKSPEDNYFLNATCLAYDLETYLYQRKIRKFPDARHDKDVIMIVGASMYRISEETSLVTFAISHKRKHSSPVKEGLIIECNDEADVLRVFYTIMIKFKPDFFNGYNSDTFDNKYINIKSQRKGLIDLLLQSFDRYYQSIGDGLKDTDVDWALYEGSAPEDRTLVNFDHNARFKSDNLRRDKLHRPRTCMVGSTDTRLYLMRLQPKEFSQERNSLNVMLQYYKVIDPESGEQMSKLDMPMEDMFRLWDTNEPDGIAEIVRYCMIDAKASYALLYKIKFFPDIFELANITSTTIPDALHRANGDKIIQTLSIYAAKEKVAFCDETPPSKYTADIPIRGTTVGGDIRSILPGIHHFVISLDFKSMYPGIKESKDVGITSEVGRM